MTDEQALQLKEIHEYIMATDRYFSCSISAVNDYWLSLNGSFTVPNNIPEQTTTAYMTVSTKSDGSYSVTKNDSSIPVNTSSNGFDLTIKAGDVFNVSAWGGGTAGNVAFVNLAFSYHL